MIDKKLSDIRTKLKQAFPEISREVDNLVGLMFEEILDNSHYAGSALQSLEKDLIYTLQAHNIHYDPEQIKNLLK